MCQKQAVLQADADKAVPSTPIREKRMVHPPPRFTPSPSRADATQAGLSTNFVQEKRASSLLGFEGKVSGSAQLLPLFPLTFLRTPTPFPEVPVPAPHRPSSPNRISPVVSSSFCRCPRKQEMDQGPFKAMWRKKKHPSASLPALGNQRKGGDQHSMDTPPCLPVTWKAKDYRKNSILPTKLPKISIEELGKVYIKNFWLLLFIYLNKSRKMVKIIHNFKKNSNKSVVDKYILSS